MIKKIEDPIELLKEIEAWLSFNSLPLESDLVSLRLSIKHTLENNQIKE